MATVKAYYNNIEAIPDNAVPIVPTVANLITLPIHLLIKITPC